MTDAPKPCSRDELDAAFQRLGRTPLVTHEDQVWVVRSRGEEIARNADMTLACGQARHWASEQASP